MTRHLTAVLIGSALLCAVPARAVEKITANAVRLGAGSSTGFLSATVDRYTTPEEHARWREAFRAGGQDALVELWQKEDVRVGTLEFDRTLGYGVRAAYSIPGESGRRLLLVTDRPIAGGEAMRNTRSLDYPIGWVELDLDAEGRGEGQLLPAVELAVENERLTVKSYGTQPVRLMSVKIQEKAEKKK